MPASWVAASVRARLLGNRRLGSARAVAIAGSAGLPAALQLLMDSPYGADLDPGMSLEAAQRQVAATTLWNLRLLAGWLPPGGSEVLQPLVAWFEIANIEDRLAYFAGRPHLPPYQLGRMDAAWRLASTATTPDAMRDALSRSRWGDPGTSDPAAMVLMLRFRWAGWVAASVPGAETWAATAVALLGARVRFAPESLPVPVGVPARVYGLPAGWQQAQSLPELRAMMPRQLAWVMDGMKLASDLWAAEARWWSRVHKEAVEMIARSRFDSSVVVGVAALLGHDAWLVRAALEAAARGRAARSVFDAVA